MAIAIDTVRIARRLRDAGAQSEQAEAFAQVVKEEVADHAVSGDDLNQLATKADIAELRGETKADIAELRGEMRAGFAEQRADFLKWIGGVIVAIVAAILIDLINR